MENQYIVNSGKIKDEWDNYNIGVMDVPEGKKITVTDPCYDFDPDCRYTPRISLPAGRYYVVVDTLEGWGVRPCKIALVKFPRAREDWNYETKKKIGSAGVDAGLCGFFIDKPDYENRDGIWLEFCDALGEENNWWESPEGFFCQSGDGDGDYPVYLYTNKKGEPTALEIDFYPYRDDWDDEDEDEDEDEEDDEEDEDE